MVNGELVEDADDDVFLDPQACLPTCLPTASFKHRDSRPRRLDKVEGSWFEAEENSADPIGGVRLLIGGVRLLIGGVRPLPFFLPVLASVQGAGAGDLAAIN